MNLFNIVIFPSEYPKSTVYIYIQLHVGQYAIKWTQEIRERTDTFAKFFFLSADNEGKKWDDPRKQKVIAQLTPNPYKSCMLILWRKGSNTSNTHKKSIDK